MASHPSHQTTTHAPHEATTSSPTRPRRHPPPPLPLLGAAAAAAAAVVPPAALVAAGAQQGHAPQGLAERPQQPPARRRRRRRRGRPKEEEEEGGAGAVTGTVLAGALLVGLVGGIGAAGYVYKDQINSFLTDFSEFIDGYGPAGYALFVLVYAGLEILAIPAIPLTMSAGLLFGSVTGTIIVSISGTIAAAVAFLIARYFARERFLKLVEGNKKFLAIDKAIGQNGFRVVTLLRLSPLLPFSLGNYLYGLTSVEFLPYVLGSWLGMLPGTWAYVSAGAFGRAIIQEESDVGLPGGNGQLLTLGVGLLFTAIAAAYITKIAKDAVKEMDE